MQRLAGDEGRVFTGEERYGADDIRRHLHARVFLALGRGPGSGGPGGRPVGGRRCHSGTLGRRRTNRLRLTSAVKEDEDEDVVLDLAANYAASYTAAIAHFVDRLADGGPFETGPDDNLETLRIIEAAYRTGGPCVHSAGTSPTC